MQVFESSVELPATDAAAFAYHERPGALQRLIQPWVRIVIESSDQSIQPGARVRLRTSVLGVPVKWTAEHRVYQPPSLFEDVSLSGPFASWHHRHRFQALPSHRSLMTDHIDYQVPLGALGELVAGAYVRRQLNCMFAYRHRVTRDDLAMAAKYSLSPLTIAVTGSSGLVGSQLIPVLSMLGHQPIAAQRHGHAAQTTFVPILRSTNTTSIHPSDAWEGYDAVVHLAGKSIADKRWSHKVKTQLRDSRVGPTRTLCETLAALRTRPKVLVCASAIGIYGDRGDESLNESAAVGDDFLAELAEQWEAACQPARDAGIRVVNLRFGIVLSPRGGALAQMLLPAKLGLGGPLGNGQQWWSWVAIDDAVGAIYHSIATPPVAGAVNVVAPTAVRQREFAKRLGQVVSRPAFLPVPAAVLRLGLGEMADGLLLSSARVYPHALLSTGYEFRFSELADSLRHLLGRSVGKSVS